MVGGRSPNSKDTREKVGSATMNLGEDKVRKSERWRGNEDLTNKKQIWENADQIL